MPRQNKSNQSTTDAEALRQESMTFDQRKRHDRQWFLLRLAMGYSAIFLLLSIFVVSACILFNYTQFPANVVAWAGPALFADILGLIITTFKIVLNPNFSTKLEPVTKKPN